MRWSVVALGATAALLCAAACTKDYGQFEFPLQARRATPEADAGAASAREPGPTDAALDAVADATAR
jgi:hypothetical protein